MEYSIQKNPTILHPLKQRSFDFQGCYSQTPLIRPSLIQLFANPAKNLLDLPLLKYMWKGGTSLLVVFLQ